MLKIDRVLFKNLIGGIRDLTALGEAKFNFTKEGLKAVVVDGSNVMMAKIEIPEDAFMVYDLTEPEHIGIDLKKIFEVVKSSKEELLEMEIDKDKNSLIVRLGNMKYTIALIDPTHLKTPKEPNLNLPANFAVDTKEFKEAIKLTTKIGVQAYLETNEEGFVIWTKGDVERLKYTIPNSRILNLDGNPLDGSLPKAKSLFAKEYLNIVAKNAFSEITKISLGIDYPVVVRFEEQIDNATACLEYIIAPRIEESD